MEDVNSAEINVEKDSPESASKTVSPVGNQLEWQVISVKPRVDSFNQDALIEEIKAAREKANETGSIKIALDLRSNKFLSFPAIKFCVSIAAEVAEKNGSFVLLGCPERTKRHFEIYGSLDHIRVVRFERDLPELKNYFNPGKTSGNA